jgi:GTPase SAR1 family protein
VTDAPAGDPSPGIAELLGELVDIATSMSRDDVVDIVAGLNARASRPDTYVVVMGEFKQGKSSLVNALVDNDLCPTDDDTATAVVTIVHHDAEPSATIRHRGSSDAEACSIGAAKAAVLDGCRGDDPVETVEFGLPHALLATGITLVDTPGVGGLNGGHSAATMAFLPFADAVLFVSDATAELSAAELEWFRVAVERCKVTVPVLTKTDLVPAWRKIMEIDTAHLRAAGSTSTINACSARAYALGVRLTDAELRTTSGIPALRSLLAKRVADPARERADKSVRTQARVLGRNLMEQIRAEFVLDNDPDGETKQQMAAAQTRLQHLKGPGSKWVQALNDASSDISNASSFQFRGAMRDLGQTLDPRVEALQSADDWDAFAASLQRDLAAGVAAVFAEVDRRFDELRGTLYEMVAEELNAAAGERRVSAVDVSAFFATTALDAPDVGKKGTATTAVRGAQSGLTMFGFLSQILPTAASALLLSSPITIALSGYFAGKAVIDARKRSLTTRRNQLKQGARKVIDDAQFELSNRISELTRTNTRELRDELGEVIALALRTNTEALEQSKRQLETDAATRKERSTLLRATSERIKALDAALTAGAR